MEYVILSVLVDVDGVLERLVPPWVRALNVKYGTNVKPEEVTEWDITKFFQGLSRNQVFSPLHTKELWANLQPMEGAVEYLKKLKNDGHVVTLVTAAHPDTVLDKWKFINRNFPYISFNDIIIAHQKQLIMGNVLIDDKPENLLNGFYYGLLMDAPHNQNFDETQYDHITRVHNWEEVYNEVTKLSQDTETFNPHRVELEY